MGLIYSTLFKVVGLDFGLGHFSVVEFGPCWCLSWTWAFQCRWVLVYSSRCQKNSLNTKKNTIFGLHCWCFWCYLLFLVFPFSWGMLHLGYAGFISSSCWAKFEPCWVVVASFSAHVGPMWGHLHPSGNHVGSCCWLYWADVVLRCVEPMWTHVALI